MPAGMKIADQWLNEYSRDYGQHTHKLIPWISIPAVVVSLVGLLWSLPVPETFREASPALNWGTVFLMAAVVYYFIISISLGIGSLPFVIVVVAAVAWADRLSVPLWLMSSIVFILAWGAQLAGQWRTGRPTSIFHNLQLLMIGPLWLLACLYRRLRIPY
jgi:hypothetical protein